MAELAQETTNVRSIYTDMPPCRKICTGRWMPLPLGPLGCQAASSCPALPSCPSLPPCAAPPTCPPPPACPPPRVLTLTCSCDEPELTCDEDTCANAADCKQLHPAICPHGLATDDDCTNCEPSLNPELIRLICPHCQSQIALFDDLKQLQPPKSYPLVTINQSQARNPCPKQSVTTRTASTETTNIGEYCLPTCPSKKSVEIKLPSCHAPVQVPCCEAGPQPRSPRISQIKVATEDDLQCVPPEPKVPKSCCAATPPKARTPSCKAITCEDIGPTCCSDEPPDLTGQMKKGPATCPMCQPPPVQCKVCLQTMAAAPPPKCCPISTAGQADQDWQSQTQKGSQPNQKRHSGSERVRGTSGKGKKDQKPPPGPNPDCQRSGASPLFPAKPAPQACLCRMPPAYTTTGCTGNLSGNCNCTACNK